MLKIDYNLLDELGLTSLPQEEKNRLLKHIYDTLEMRVGMTLASQMSDQQLDEFEEIAKKKDDNLALQWLETNFPDYKVVVEKELTLLKEEIKQDAEALIEATTNESPSQA
jgi:hypothetical protein